MSDEITAEAPEASETADVESAQPTETIEKPNLDADGNAVESADVEAEAPEKPEEPVVPRTFKVKIDGEEIEVSEEQLLKDYQLSRASMKRFEEASNLKKELEEVLLQGKENPDRILARLGIDPVKYAEEKINQALEEQMLSEEERQVRDLKRQLAEKEAIIQKEEEAKKQMELTKQEQELVAKWQSELTDAVKTSGLPDNDYVRNRFLHYKEHFLKNDVDLPFSDVQSWVTEDYQKEISSLVTSANAETLGKIFGEEGLKKVREMEIAKLKASNPKITTPDEQAPAKKVEPKQMTWKEVMAEIEERYGKN